MPPLDSTEPRVEVSHTKSMKLKLGKFQYQYHVLPAHRLVDYKHQVGDPALEIVGGICLSIGSCVRGFVTANWGQKLVLARCGFREALEMFHTSLLRLPETLAAVGFWRGPLDYTPNPSTGHPSRMRGSLRSAQRKASASMHHASLHRHEGSSSAQVQWLAWLLIGWPPFSAWTGWTGCLFLGFLPMFAGYLTSIAAVLGKFGVIIHSLMESRDLFLVWSLPEWLVNWRYIMMYTHIPECRDFGALMAPHFAHGCVCAWIHVEPHADGWRINRLCLQLCQWGWSLDTVVDHSYMRRPHDIIFQLGGQAAHTIANLVCIDWCCLSSRMFISRIFWVLILTIALDLLHVRILRRLDCGDSKNWTAFRHLLKAKMEALHFLHLRRGS